MDQLSPIHSGHYSHDLLLHEGDDELLEGTRAFVEQGLASGGKVLVHGTPERVAMMRAALDSHPQLDFGLDRDLYLAIEHPVRLSARQAGRRARADRRSGDSRG